MRTREEALALGTLVHQAYERICSTPCIPPPALESTEKPLPEIAPMSRPTPELAIASTRTELPGAADKECADHAARMIELGEWNLDLLCERLGK